MDDFASSGVSECVNYPMVHHITDATVIQINKPGGDHLESRAYFSGKHKLYCMKVEASKSKSPRLRRRVVKKLPKIFPIILYSEPVHR